MARNGVFSGGGSRLGKPNKATADVAAKLAAIGCDPISGMALLAMGQAPCPPCHGSGKAAAPVRTDKPVARAPTKVVCAACGGTGKDIVPTKLRGDMMAELAQYIAPKRRAIEYKGDVLGVEALLARLDGDRPA